MPVYVYVSTRERRATFVDVYIELMTMTETVSALLHTQILHPPRGWSSHGASPFRSFRDQTHPPSLLHPPLKTPAHRLVDGVTRAKGL